MSRLAIQRSQSGFRARRSAGVRTAGVRRQRGVGVMVQEGGGFVVGEEQRGDRRAISREFRRVW